MIDWQVDDDDDDDDNYRTDFYSDLSNVSPTDFTSEGSPADSKYALSFLNFTTMPNSIWTFLFVMSVSVASQISELRNTKRQLGNMLLVLQPSWLSSLTPRRSPSS